MSVAQTMVAVTMTVTTLLAVTLTVAMKAMKYMMTCINVYVSTE